MNELKEQRLKKLKELSQLGINPYGRRFDRKNTVADCHDNFQEGKEVIVAGRLTAIRGHGKTIFSDLHDSSGKIQLYIRQDSLSEKDFTMVKLLDLGDIVGVRGELFITHKGEISIMVEELTLLSKALQPLPEKWHGLKDLESRYRKRYLDLIVNEEAEQIFRTRSRIIREIRKYLEEREFIEVETPMMQVVPGGAAARPFETFYTALDSKMYLRIAPELYLKRLLVGGLEKVYELNRNFRNEGLSRKHNPEFTMLEIYEAYGDCRTMMELVESLVSVVAERSGCGLKIKHGEDIVDLTPPWRRVKYRNLVCEHMDTPDWFSLSSSEMVEKAAHPGLDISESMLPGDITHEIYEKVIEPGLIQPTFVLDLPAELVPLARRCEEDPGLVDVFELVINGSELAPGYSELNDPIEQRLRFESQETKRSSGGDDLPAGKGNIDEEFLTAMETGMPPAGGTGIGIDRLVMVLTGAENIRDVILFPQLRPKLD